MILILLVGVSLIFFRYYINSPIEKKPHTVLVDIPRGSSFLAVVDIMDQAGLVKNKPFFMALTLYRQAARNLRAGEYEFVTSMTPNDIISKLIRGDIKEYKITIPEDWTLQEIANRLEANKLINRDAFFSLAKDQDFLKSLGIDAPSVEGYLFPDTYEFDRSMTTQQIMTIMVHQFRKKITPDLCRRAASMGMTKTQWVTLASMIGKEASVKEEKSLVSAVFHNRLKKRMKLQSDPTTVYGLNNFRGPITRRDLLRYSPHNTYQIAGLPPGPIGNPGLDSLQAALYPAPVKYLYFVSRNDGTHQFSTTYSEHSEAILLYQPDR
ncbi:MAG: endolytic transglycosylase MltG [Syntrophales bacterium]|jgi:UPF0755 protein